MEIVLVVDDEPDIRTVVRSMLTAKGYTVVETGDPQQAIRMATQQAIHLLFVSVGRSVGQKRSQLLCRRRESGKIQRDAAQ